MAVKRQPKKAPALRQYRADRDFNEVNAGDVLELPADHPYLATGYMEPVEADGDEPEPEQQNVGMNSTTAGNPAGDDAGGPAVGEMAGEASGEAEGQGGAGQGDSPVSGG